MMATGGSIRVMVVDDHPVVRRGLAAFLSVHHDLTLIGEAGDGLEALDIFEKLHPDVILMDLVMPQMDGISAIRIIRRRRPRVQILALTNFEDKELVRRALQAGAIGYLLKNVTAGDLVCAIRAAYEGRATLAPEATRTLVIAARRPLPPGHDLTPREWEVLHLMTKGYSNPKIAGQLNVSRSTVRAHVSQILSKLGVTNRAEAIAFAFRSKLVT